MPAELATRVSDLLTIPTIGIGAGSQTDAQVLVWQDLLGLTPGPGPKFVRRYADLRQPIYQAVAAWTADVADGNYPGPEESYN